MRTTQTGYLLRTVVTLARGKPRTWRKFVILCGFGLCIIWRRPRKLPPAYEVLHSLARTIPFDVRTDLELERLFLPRTPKQQDGSTNTTASAAAAASAAAEVGGNLPFTSHRCVETPYLGDWVMSRTCLYYNLYYHPTSKTFLYNNNNYNNRSSSSSSSRVSDQETSISGYMMAGGNNPRTKPFDHYFRPVLLSSFDGDKLFINSTSAVARVKAPSNPIFVLYNRSYNDFDDIRRIFAMLDLFGYTKGRSWHQPIPVQLEQNHFRDNNADPNYGCRNNPNGRWPKKCTKMLKRVIAELLGICPDLIEHQEHNNNNDMMATTTTTTTTVDIPRIGNLFGCDVDSFLVQRPQDTNFVLLPEVIAGPGPLPHADDCAGQCTRIVSRTATTTLAT